MVNVELWNEIKDSLPLGTKLRGAVTKHFNFGIFIVLPEIEFMGTVKSCQILIGRV